MARIEEDSAQTPEKENQTNKNSDNGLSLVESFLLLLKLRVLSKKFGIENVGEKALTDLRKRIVSKDAKEQKAAENELGELFRKVVQVEKGLDENVTLTSAIANNVPPSVKEKAKQIDEEVGSLRELADRGELEQNAVEQAIENLNEFAGEMGVSLENKETITTVVEKELRELTELRDRVQLGRQRKEIIEIVSGDKDSRKKRIEEILKEEDFKENPQERERKFRVKRGKNREKKQERVDRNLGTFRTDMEKLERMSEEELVGGVLRAKELAQGATACGDNLLEIEAAHDLAFKMGSIYNEALTAKIVENAIKSRDNLNEAQLSILRTELKNMCFTRLSELWIDKEGMSRSEQIEWIEKIQKEAETFEAGMRLLITKDDGQKLVESEYLARRNESFRRGNKIFDSGENDLHMAEMNEALSNQQYEQYTKLLISYLFKVGLREGMHDLRLTDLMTKARLKLADSGNGELLMLFNAFERLAQFHDGFAMIGGAEDMARVLKNTGVEPFQAWLGKSADRLSTKIEFEDGKEISLASWKFHNMMQSEEWTHKLIYSSSIDEEHMYDQMMYTQLFGEGEYEVRSKDIEVEVENTNGEKVKKMTRKQYLWKKTYENGSEWKVAFGENGDLSQKILVDNKEVAIGDFVRDGRWMIGIAHDTWKLSGRWANVLDNVQIGNAKMNKNLLAIYQIRRYCEEYGIVSPYLYKAISMDAFIYSFENYKGLAREGLNRLFIEADAGNRSSDVGVNNEELPTKEVADVSSIIHNHLKRVRELNGEEFRTNYIPLEDARLLGVKKSEWTYERAEQEYLRRQLALGKTNVRNEIKSRDYQRQIEFLRKKWERMAFSDEERAKIEALDWAKINREYEKRLGLEEGSIGNSFEDFIKNFNYTKLYDYNAPGVRGTELENYGKYFMLSEKVVSLFKAGFKGASTEAMQEALGTMTAYQAYASSGYKRYAAMMLGHVYDLRRRMTKIFEYDATTENGSLDQDKLTNGEYIVDENGFVVSDLNKDGTKKKRNKLTLINQSVMSKEMNIKSLNERDIEYAMQAAVAKGIIWKNDAERFLDKRYGGRVWRWLKRSFWFDSPYFLIDAVLEEGGKTVGAVAKHIFS